MAIELKQNLKLSQQLVITPQLQQAIKLLQLSRIELSEMIKDELTENPVLEEAPRIEDEDVPRDIAKEIEPIQNLTSEHQSEVMGADGEMKEPKDFDWENYIQSYNDPGEGFGVTQIASDEIPNYENMVTKTTTLQDHLEWQLRMTDISTDQEEIANQIIGSLDDNGYLRLSLEEISQKEGYALDQLESTLQIIQNFDPLGVGARSIQECLLIQAKPFEKEFPFLENIIVNHLPLLEKKDYHTLSKKIKVTFSHCKRLAEIICNMEPKPGRPFSKSDTLYVTPDVYVTKVGSDYNIVLNDEGMPRLRVNSFYRKMIAQMSAEKNGHTDNADDSAKDYVQEKLKNALWLIKSLHQRQKTLYRVTKCIVNYQREFLDKGIKYLKPMVLRDVAEEIGVHESTVSRATNSKYVHSPQGIFELKYFFNSAISTGQGQDMASEAVKQRIKQLISEEDLKKPFSDKQLVEFLEKEDIKIARRTVAKYREMLGILPSSKRRRLC